MIPALSFDSASARPVPDEAACLALWDKYAMLPNVRDHSRAVATTALYAADKALSAGFTIDKKLVLAAALLHDIAKTYTIRFGGSHEQLGAAIVQEESGNPALAQAVLFHVRWPWEDGVDIPFSEPLRLPLLVSWADKRVRHDKVVSLQERFEDLLIRYGVGPVQREMIIRNNAQARALEEALEKLLGPLNPPQAEFPREA